VQGSEGAPYHVRIPLAEGERGEAFCTCPYEWGGWCKHAVAVALYAADDPEGLDVRPPLAETLAAQKPAALRGLLLSLAAADPVLAWRIEQHLDPDQAMPDWEEDYWV